MTAFIAGDWGLSHLRLWLCDAAGQVLDRRQGPGIAAAQGAFATIMAERIAGWDDGPIALCGMVGSGMGWAETPYVAAPASLSDIAAAVVSLAFGDRHVTIVPGVCGRSAFDAPDVMRGEETQIIGALRLRPELRQGVHQFCLPGTHTKWAGVRDGCIETITTSVSGELFALLRRHGTLCQGTADSTIGAESEAFQRGLARSDVPLLSALFETRSRRLTGDLAAAEAQDFLSGVIIGADVRCVRPGPVVVIGAAPLRDLYAEALRRRGGEPICLDGNDCARSGLVVLLP